MNAETKLINLANHIAATERVDLGTATKRAAARLSKVAEAHRLAIQDPENSDMRTPAEQAAVERAKALMAAGLPEKVAIDQAIAEQPLLLSQQRSSAAASASADERFLAMVNDYAKEHGMPLRLSVEPE